MKTLTQLSQRSRPAAAFANLPKWLKTALNSCPPAGEGVHFWIFRIARNLIVHMSEADIFTLLKNKVATCGRRVPEKEILSQIRNARVYAWRPEKPNLFPLGAALPDEVALRPPSPAWPKANHEAIRSIVGGGGGLYDLAERSPIRFGNDEPRTEEIIDVLFPGDPLLCIGTSSDCFATRRREIWRGHLSRLSLIVPNPMLEVWGHTKIENRLSQHTLEKTARRVYLGVEFDFSEFTRDGRSVSGWAPLVREWRDAGVTVADACAALHLHLATLLPLVAVVHSAGKSLHGWYYVFDKTDVELRPFMDYAVSLGADHATWLRSQFIRLPDGLRENGRRQVTYYLDPGKAVKNA